MGMLFLNSLKGLRFKKIQMAAIVLLIMLSTGIYTGLNMSLDRMESRYNKYLEEQNVEDFAYDVKIDYAKDYSKEDIDNLLKDKLKDIPKEQKEVMYVYKNSLGNEDKFSKEQLDKIYNIVEYIFNNNEVNEEKIKEISKTKEEKYDITTGIEKGKILVEDGHTHKAILYNENNKINIPYVIEGELPKEKDEVTLLPNYAEKNEYKINDYIDVGDKLYKIVGLAYSPNHVYPMISMTNPIMEDSKTNIMYMKEETFNEFIGEKDYANIAAFNDKSLRKTIPDVEEIIKDDEDIKISLMTMPRMMRLKMFDNEITNNKQFAKYFMILILAIAVFVIYIITKKRIQEEKKQIGVLKALGYKGTSIAISYLVYPIIGGVLGGLLGITIGILVNTPVTEIFISYYNVPIDAYKFNIKYLVNVVLMPTAILSVISYLISIIMLRKRALHLLKEGTNLKVNIFSKFVALVTRKSKFKTKFKYMLATRSIGKLLTILITSFCCGLLIVFTLITMDMFSSMVMSTFESFDFDYQVSYLVEKQGESKDEDYILEEMGKIIEVERDGEVEKLVDKRKEGEDFSFSELKKDMENAKENIGKEKETETETKKLDIKFEGIDKKPNFVTLRNEEGEKVLPKLALKENSVIINRNVKDILELDVGDKIKVKVLDKEFTLEVVGIDNSYMATLCYINRNTLNKLLDYKENTYNAKFTTDLKYANIKDVEKEERDNISGIFPIKDLQKNMEKNFEKAEAVIYIIITFAGVMAFIIIGVIANVVVEENKRNISLMKVCGYKNKKISQMVLNIYTPFVVIAYLLSIPAMVYILKFILKLLLQDMTFSFVISLSVTKCLIGLVALLTAYYLAIYISKKVLNKVPLSIALKRE